MKKIKKSLLLATPLVLLLLLTLASCSIRYSFNGSSINYDIVKSITIEKFPIRTAYVWAPMEAMFYNTLTDAYNNKTKLQVLKRGGDLSLAGEITEYSQLNKSISSDGYSAQTQLKITVNVRFVNNTKHEEDFERQCRNNSSRKSSTTSPTRSSTQPLPTGKPDGQSRVKGQGMKNEECRLRLRMKNKSYFHS